MMMQLWLLKFYVHFSFQMSTRCPIGHDGENFAAAKQGFTRTLSIAALLIAATQFALLKASPAMAEDTMEISRDAAWPGG